MNAQFVSLAVAYCLGAGVIRRKGVKQRPWLEIQRLETESTYLEHQVRALRRATRQSIRVEEDLLPGKGYYDVLRVRIQAPALERAAEILADGISDEALQVAGAKGIASLWIDNGYWGPGGGAICTRSPEEAAVVCNAVREKGSICSWVVKPASVCIPAESMHSFASLLRPETHRSMRHALRFGAFHGAALLESQNRRAPTRRRLGSNGRSRAVAPLPPA